MRSRLSNLIKGLAIVAGSFIGATSAQAGFSSIGKLGVGEAALQLVFEHAYGGSWHKVGDDFYNGTMSAKRMDDFMSDAGVLNIAKGQCGYSTDQTWCGNKFEVNAIAKFSGYNQKLATQDENGHTHNLLDVQGYGFDIDPATATIDMHGKEFNWLRDGESGLQSSIDGANSDGRDHLITYIVEGLPGIKGPVWMMFFEDMNKLANTPKNRTFADYNDLIVEVRSVVSAVPLPPAGWAGLFTIAGGALVRSRKHIWRAVTA